MFPCSSVVEQLTVNQLVGGSNPSKGAKMVRWPSGRRQLITNQPNVRAFRGFESHPHCQVSTSPKGTAIRRQHRHSLCLLGRHIGIYPLSVLVHFLSGCNSVVECQPSKLFVASSILVTRSK